jgi:putative Ca2+/H+ antiporter (TMEM165/GDT1 family)
LVELGDKTQLATLLASGENTPKWLVSRPPRRRRVDAS